jgi:hypothetical protein
MKDGKAKLFIPGVDSIGYYYMVNKNVFPCFMVTDTPSLMLVERKKDGGKYIAQNIGRCIKLFPNSTRITYLTKDTEKVWTIRSYDYVSREYSVITEVPATGEDFVWTDFSHRLLMARGNEIWMYDTTVSRSGWVKACEIPSLAGKNIYRLALSPDGKTLAFVADE